MASLSGKQLHIRETNPSFRNKSQLLLPLGEEIVHPLEKLDLLSPFIKGKRIRPKKVGKRIRPKKVHILNPNSSRF